VPTVISQTGEFARLVSWIKRANRVIQNEFTDWLFLRRQTTVSTNTTNNIITPPANLNVWDIDRIYDNQGNKMDVKPYSELDYKIDTTVKGKPSLLIINDNNTISTYPCSDAVYTYSVDYFINPVALVNDSDVSVIPEKYHDAILGRAMIYYGNYESAPEIKQQGAEMYEEVISQLRKNQLPNKRQFYAKGDPAIIQVIAQ